MSLFAVYYDLQNFVDLGMDTADPKKVNINGEVVGSCFSGEIEMIYQNDTETAYKYTILFGKYFSNVCIHDFKVLLDENPIILKCQENFNFQKKLHILENQLLNTCYEIIPEFPTEYKRDDYLTIGYVFPNQILRISAEFEMPIQYISRSTFVISFPLCCSGYSKSYILKCENFNFSCKFNSLPLKSNSITSNPEGKINLQESVYMIDHLDPELSRICISYDLNPPTYSENLDLIHIPSKSVLFEDGCAFYCEKYASITFFPTKKEAEDHSGEEFIFLVDCSQSMSRDEIKLASECLIYFIKSLPINCFFNIIRFGSKSDLLFPKPVLYTEENVQKAMELAINLKADLEGTDLYQPLLTVFTTPLSKENKLRRVFIITDGKVNNPNKVINLVNQVSSTTVCNAIGLGYIVDRSLVEGIGNNGFVDFVLSGDDIKEKVIGQLDKSLNGNCFVDLSFGIKSDIDITPPLSGLSYNKPVTFFIKSSNNLPNKFDIKIDVKGLDNPIIIHANSLPANSKADKILKYLFVNQELKHLYNSNQTVNDMKKIADLSIKYNISSPYTTFSGILKYISPDAKQRMKQIKIKYETQKGDSILKMLNKVYDTWNDAIPILFKLFDGRHIYIRAPPDIEVKDLKILLEEKSGFGRDILLIYYAGAILQDEETMTQYIKKELCGFFVSIRHRNGLLSGTARSYFDENVNDMIKIISQQRVEGYWSGIPSCLTISASKKIKTIIQKVINWAKNKNFQKNEDKVVGTVICLIYMLSTKKELHMIWNLIYKKALKWLCSQNKSIDWEAIINAHL